MSYVRDSYWSRDYHKGTGSQVFLTENPGRYILNDGPSWMFHIVLFSFMSFYQKVFLM
jgi:hypothetical protein